MRCTGALGSVRGGGARTALILALDLALDLALAEGGGARGARSPGAGSLLGFQLSMVVALSLESHLPKE